MTTTSSNVDVIIYRVNEKGLEVFLVNGNDHELENWNPCTADDSMHSQLRKANCIELEPFTNAAGETRQAVAIEADWHDIPSLRALIYEDYRVAKEKAKNKLLHLLPDVEKGAYFAVKEAFKKVLPEQYAFLKELKDVILEKNQAKYV